MLEQWEADALLGVEKMYSHDPVVRLSQGVDYDYQTEAVDEWATFLLDVLRSRRNPRKARYQLRYRRDVVLARLCTSVPHTNPDGEELGAPHLHWYREGDETDGRRSSRPTRLTTC